MNQVFKEGMQKITKLLEVFYTKNMTIKVYSEHDVKGLAEQMSGEYVSNLKSIYPVKFIWRKLDRNLPADLTILFSCYESNEDKVIIDKEKLFSHKELKIKFYFQHWKELGDAYSDIFIPWASKFKHRTFNKPIELEMCSLPNDASHPRYREWKKDYFKFLSANPQFARSVQNEHKRI